MNNEMVFDKLNWLRRLLNTFVESLNIQDDDFSVSVPDLISIIVDVNKEIDQIKQFHSLDYISTAKELSLYCYYILKRKPIMIKDEEKYPNQINEKFCVSLLLSSVNIEKKLNKEYIRFLVDMFYRAELTKDAIYLLANTLKQMEEE
ncbi:MAG: hypothetical protein ACLUFN_04800 [Eubacterium sp.]